MNDEDTRFRCFVFANYVTASGIAAAYREATEPKQP